MRSTFFDEATTRKKLAEFVQSAPKLSMGKKCEEFERAFSQYQGRRFSVLMGNGSLANLGLVQALLNLGKLKQGNRVGFSAVTWSTNVMPLLQLGLIPVPLDCDIDHLNVTSETLEKSITSLSALFITNALGLCGDLATIRTLCEQHGVLLLEDNCESLGSKHQGALLGNFGLASTFSFFVGHHLSTIEGGMVCTDDEALAAMLLMVRSHGWDRSLDPALQQMLRKKHNVDAFRAQYTFYELAYNLRPTEITGFLGSLQLPLLEETVEKRELNFRAFRQSVAKRSDLYYPLHTDHIERVSSFSMPIVTRSEDVLRSCCARFEKAGVETRPIIAGNIEEHPFWTKTHRDTSCPKANTIHRQGFYFPNNADLTTSEVSLLCRLIEEDS